MKKIFLLIGVLAVFTGIQAQSIESIRNTALLQQFKKAKEDLDKAMSNTKFASKPEAFILKAFVYGSLAMDPSKKGTAEAVQLLDEADAAFKKYKEMDPSQALVADQVYQNGPINIYSGYYSLGYEDYAGKKWSDGASKLKKAVEYSDILISKNLLQAPLDTNVLILAGITSENAKHTDDAATYYKRLADHKIAGHDYESIYRYLVNYYFGKRDFANFEKYKALGAELFPKSEFFTYDKVDFAVGLETNFNDKLKSVEEVLASSPNDFKANQVLGEIIYDTLNVDEEKGKLPANTDELEKKMVSAFQKAAAAKPGFENPYLYLGDHFINKAAGFGKEREKLQADIKARTKPGQPISKEDVAKRDALDKQYGDILEQAREPYEKAAAILAAKTNINQKEKQQYKKAASYLADIAAFKKAMANQKKNTADAAKYAAEEKKWNDLWDSIK